MRRVAVRGGNGVVATQRGHLLRTALIGVIFAALVAVPRHANAACTVTTTGTVNCAANTTTTRNTNLDGSNPSSSDRTQRFHNGAAISGTIQSGVTVGGLRPPTHGGRRGPSVHHREQSGPGDHR